MTYLYGYIKYHYIYIIPIISFKKLISTKNAPIKNGAFAFPISKNNFNTKN